RAASIEPHRHPARVHRQCTAGRAAQRPEARPGQVTAVVFVPAEPGLVRVAAAVAARAVVARLAARILVVASFVAAIPVLGEPLPRIAAAGRGVVVVVLVVVVLHWSHTEVGLDLVQCAHRLTPSKALVVPVSVMKMWLE